MELAIFQSPSDPKSPPERLSALETALQGHSFDLVLCPELFMTGYNIGSALRDLAQPVDGVFKDAVAALAKRHNTAIAYGYPEAAGGVIYNSVQLVGHEGQTLANHRKRLPAPHSFEETVFANGKTSTWIDMDGLRIGMIICYEVELPEFLRMGAEAGVDLMLVPTALGRDWAIIAEKMVPTRALGERHVGGLCQPCGC